MQIIHSTIVVTGAGSGIGRALVEKFVRDGASTVVAVDLNEDTARQTAKSFGCIAMQADVAVEEDIVRVIEATETTHGSIDLFCSNAGIAAGLDEQAADDEWSLSWGVNVMSHVYAARHLVPKMIARGGGYLLNTASAAGLLNQIGGAAYGVTKHAAVGFAEWLAFTYGHRGLNVSVLCPQAVRTAMTDNDDPATRAAAGDGMLEPERLAEIVIEHLEREEFLILTHPEVLGYMQNKTADYNRWVSGMNRLARKLTEGD